MSAETVFKFDMKDRYDDVISVYIEGDLEHIVYIEFKDADTKLETILMSLDAARVDSLIAALQQARQRMTEAGE